MTSRAKELLLHRVIATSAFVFALCILPVSQYLLIGKVPASPGGSGTVAGASTDASIIERNVPAASPATAGTCQIMKQQKLDSLSEQQKNWAASIKVLEQGSVKDYAAQIAALTGTPQDVAERTGQLNAAMSQSVDSYEAAIGQAAEIVSSQKNEIASAPCLAE